LRSSKGKEPLENPGELGIFGRQRFDDIPAKSKTFMIRIKVGVRVRMRMGMKIRFGFRFEIKNKPGLGYFHIHVCEFNSFLFFNFPFTGGKKRHVGKIEMTEMNKS
jgi:hypothetical protein